ncbi:uncharacterized protein LOC128233929 isoform X2 [Mya arenaria]|nr:uncharacterized protein LOC128233929 isoform X2 [Mya arenaria]XP_052803771.1 uncharacterized protein LOC128233929 isoform X2 [Mya arenaria]
MKVTIKERLCYLLLLLVATTVSGEVNLTASGSFIDNTYVVKTGSSVTLTCSNSDKATYVSIADKDGTVLGSCTVFMGDFTCTPTSSYTVDKSDASLNYFRYVIGSFQKSNCGTYKCELGTDSTVFSSITVEHEVYYNDPCGSTCGTCEVNNFDCQATTNKCVCKGDTIPDSDDSTKCNCKCKVLQIVWSVIFIVLSTLSGAVVLFVIFSVQKARNWLSGSLCASTYLCMSVWVVFSFVYSIVAVVLYYVLVCKDGSIKEDCWPVYIIIGIVFKAVDVVVAFLAVLAFLKGDTADAESPTPMYESQVVATNQPKDAKHKEAMDRPQPLPPVGGQKEHGKGHSANDGDIFNMPDVGKKKLPPLSG